MRIARCTSRSNKTVAKSSEPRFFFASNEIMVITVEGEENARTRFSVTMTVEEMMKMMLELPIIKVNNAVGLQDTRTFFETCRRIMENQ